MTYFFDSVFLEEPAGGEGTVFVPVNSTTTFRCSVAMGYTISWQLQVHGAEFPDTLTTDAQFELSGVSSRSSTLTIHNVTEELNATSVICLARESVFSNEGSAVFMIVYGMFSFLIIIVYGIE